MQQFIVLEIIIWNICSIRIYFYYFFRIPKRQVIAKEKNRTCARQYCKRISLPPTFLNKDINFLMYITYSST